MSRRTRLLVALLAALPLAACGLEEKAEVTDATPVVLAPVSYQDLEVRIESSGQLLAKNRALIAAEVSGQVTETRVEEGSHVAAGDVVLEIDPERKQLELQSARARGAEVVAALREQEREVARMRKLRDQDIASAARLDQSETQLSLARSRVAAAEAQVGGAERALRDASVQAPFAGSIGRRLVARGEFVNPGTPLFELVALDPIEVEFNLAEVDSGRVAPGAPVEVTVSPFPDEIFDARVTVVSPTIDPATRTLRVKAELANSEEKLRPGLFARVNLGVDVRRNVTMIPEEALLPRAEGAVVFRVNGESRAERVGVTVGVHREGQVEVTGGLGPGDHVVVRGHAWLSDGQLVDARNPDGTRARLAEAEAPVAAGEVMP